MSDEWERPPPKLVRGKRKFPWYLIFLIIGLYLGGVIVWWAVARKQLPIDFILGGWFIVTVILAMGLLLSWWVITS